MLTKIKRITCVLIGHSNIVSNCFGYKHCARCEDLVGDSLGGVWSNDKAVIVGHNCDTCQTNYANMGWKDKLFCPNPFKEGESR